MSDLPIRRVLWVMLAYGVGAAVILVDGRRLWAEAGPRRRTLALSAVSGFVLLLVIRVGEEPTGLLR